MAKKNLRNAQAREREQKEFDEEVLEIARVTRVVKGGRRLRFRATVAIGDRKGRVGMGTGKSSEVVGAIKKAVATAKRSLIHVPITNGDTIPHPIQFKYKAVRMMMLPASPGTGVIAGGSLRKILGLAGIKNVLSKHFGSRNTLVTAQASLAALKTLAPLKPYMHKKEGAIPDASIVTSDLKAEENKDTKAPKTNTISIKDTIELESKKDIQESSNGYSSSSLADQIAE
jgi:small subunit ribosomal protein S5